jgi:LacI family transcriptional regulator
VELKILHPEGYHVMIFQTHEEIENINTLLNAQVDEILMSITNASKDTENVIKRVVNNHVHLKFFDRKLNLNDVNSVIIDDFEGGYRATNHLI